MTEGEEESTIECQVMLAMWLQLRAFDGDKRARILQWLSSKSGNLYVHEMRKARAKPELGQVPVELDAGGEP